MGCLVEAAEKTLVDVAFINPVLKVDADLDESVESSSVPGTAELDAGTTGKAAEVANIDTISVTSALKEVDSSGDTVEEKRITASVELDVDTVDSGNEVASAPKVGACSDDTVEEICVTIPEDGANSENNGKVPVNDVVPEVSATIV